MYLDKPSGQVRIPVDRAMELVLQDEAAGKTFYPAQGRRLRRRKSLWQLLEQLLLLRHTAGSCALRLWTKK